MGSPEEDLLPVDESTVTVKQPKRAVGARKAKKSAAVEFFDVEVKILVVIIDKLSVILQSVQLLNDGQMSK